MNIKKYKILYYVLILIAFYLLPLVIYDTGSAMFALLMVIPLIVLNSSILFGRTNGFNWQYSLLVALLFIPSVFIFYNTSALIYVPIYGLISIIGLWIGNMLKNITSKNK